MRTVYTFIIFATLGLVGFGSAQASHYMGGQITYTALGNNVYQITEILYRDCAGQTVGTSSTINVSPTNSGSSFALPRVAYSDITPLCPGQVSRCASAAGAYGVEEYIFRGNITLQPLLSGGTYTISATLCCRNNAITTVTAAGGQQMFLSTTLNPNLVNSSPVFLNRPIAFLCANQPATISPNAYDPDGDAIVYSLAACRDAGTSDPVTYAPGFGAAQPLSSATPFTINPNTGSLSFTPTAVNEVAIVCIRASEYRDGIKIGEIVRDIQIRVLNCDNAAPTFASLPSVIVPAGQTYQVDVTAMDANNDLITLTATSGIIPPATFEVTSSIAGMATGRFSFTPTTADIGNTYTVTINAQDNGCPAPAIGVGTFNITVPATCDVDAIGTATPASCGTADGLAQVDLQNGTAPIQYAWSGPNGYASFDQSLSGLAPGTYCVTVVDGNGCVDSTCVVVEGVATEPLAVTTTVETACGEGAGRIETSVTGGCTPYAYAWSTGGTACTLSGLYPGTYTLTVTDAGGNDLVTSVTVSQPDPIAVSVATTHAQCAGSSTGSAQASITGGTAPFQYLWNTGHTSAQIDGLAAGTYALTVTDALGCIGVQNITIVEPAPLTVTAAPNTTVYYGYGNGCATLSASIGGGAGNVTGTWYDPQGNVVGTTVCPTASTTYCYVATDGNGCTASACMTVCVINLACVDNTNNGQTGSGNAGGGVTYGQGTGQGLTHIIICHIPPSAPQNAMTQCIPIGTVAYHLSHGDYLGPCGAQTYTCNPGANKAMQDLQGTLDMTVYPNPNAGLTQLDLACPTCTGPVHLELVDAQGRTVRIYPMELQDGQASLALDMKAEAPGIYFLIATNNGLRTTQKIIKR